MFVSLLNKGHKNGFYTGNKQTKSHLKSWLKKLFFIKTCDFPLRKMPGSKT